MDASEVTAQLDKMKAAADEHSRLTTELGKRSAARASAAVAAAESASARFRKLADRVRAGAEERARAAQSEELADDDPVAELEALAEAISERDPDEPDDAEVDEFVDTMLPLAPPVVHEQDLPDTSVAQWTSNKRARPAGEPDDDDFENPW